MFVVLARESERSTRAPKSSRAEIEATISSVLTMAVCTENLNPNIMVMKAAEDCI